MPVRRDPRFLPAAAAGPLTSAANQSYLFRYKFLDANAERDISELREAIRAEREAREGGSGQSRRSARKRRRMSDEELAEAQADLTRLEKYMAETRRARAVQERVREELERGRRVTPRDRKRLALEQRFEELRARPKKLELFLKDKRERVAARAKKEQWKERTGRASSSSVVDAGKRRPAASLGASSAAPPLGF